MYRKGIPAAKFAEVSRTAAYVVWCYFAVAVKQEPSLRAPHRAARPPDPAKATEAGQRVLTDLLAFYTAEGRLPIGFLSGQESRLADWLSGATTRLPPAPSPLL